MKSALLQVFAAPAYGPSVNIRHRLKKRRIEFHGVIRFREREFRNSRVEL